ncbi:hypothetical protein M0R72_13425 [Candidatus Pacearchaeota archaeon]|nr:hypothetical protein [Candidatus Pacearchaeota archaeon]
MEGKDAPATADKIKKEAKDAHDSEAARVAALPADAVVDALPNAGEVRGVRDGAIERGKARIADLLNRYRVGADGRGDPGGGGPDGNGGG